MKRLLLVLLTPFFFTQFVTAQSDREILRLGRGTANALDWRPDGEVLAVGSGTGIWLYDENFETLAHLEDAETGNVQTVKWSPQGDRLANANDTGTLQIWNVADDLQGEVILTLDEVGTSVEWSPDGDKLAVATWDDTAFVLSTRSGEPLLEIEEVNYPGTERTGLAWDPNGELLAIGTYQNIQIWDVNASENMLEITGESLRGHVVDFSPDGTRLSTLCGYDTETDLVARIDLCQWNPKTGEEISSFELGSGLFLFIKNAIWSPDWSQLAYIVQGVGRGRIGDPISVIREDHTDQYIGSGYAAAWKPHSEILAIADVQGIIRNYDVSTGDITAETNFHTPALTSVAFSPDGTRIAATGFGYWFPVNVWEASSNVATHTSSLTIYPEIVDSVQWKPDGKELVTFGNNQGETAILYEVVEWDAATGERLDFLYSFYSQFETLPIVAWNSNFTRSAQSNRDTIVEISNDVSLTATGDTVQEIVWSPDDSLIATVSRELDSDIPIIEIWNVETGSRIGSVEYHAQFHQLVWSPNSDSFAVLGIHMGEYGTYFVEIYDAQANITHFELVIENSWLPAIGWNNGSDLMAIYAEEEISIYDVENSEIILTIPADRITSLSWSPDDTRLAGGSADGTIRIWDVSDLASLAP